MIELGGKLAGGALPLPWESEEEAEGGWGRLLGTSPERKSEHRARGLPGIIHEEEKSSGKSGNPKCPPTPQNWEQKAL